MLETIGRRIPIDFCQLPAVFALHWTEQAPDVGPGVVTGFAPCKVRHKPSFHLSQPEGPFTYRLQRQVAWHWALLLPSFHGSIPPQGVWNHDNIRSTTVVLGRGLDFNEKRFQAPRPSPRAAEVRRHKESSITNILEVARIGNLIVIGSVASQKRGKTLNPQRSAARA